MAANYHHMDLVVDIDFKKFGDDVLAHPQIEASRQDREPSPTTAPAACCTDSMTTIWLWYDSKMVVVTLSVLRAHRGVGAGRLAQEFKYSTDPVTRVRTRDPEGRHLNNFWWYLRVRGFSREAQASCDVVNWGYRSRGP